MRYVVAIDGLWFQAGLKHRWNIQKIQRQQVLEILASMNEGLVHFRNYNKNVQKLDSSIKFPDKPKDRTQMWRSNMIQPSIICGSMLLYVWKVKKPRFATQQKAMELWPNYCRGLGLRYSIFISDFSPYIYICSSTLRLRCSPLISNFSAECWTRSIVFVSGEVAHELLPKVVRSHQKSMFKDFTVNKCSSTMTYPLNGSFHIFVYIYICISYIWHILWPYHTYQWFHSLDLMDAGVRRQKCSAPGRRLGKPMGNSWSF